MYCANCDNELKEPNQKVCENCGYEIPSTVAIKKPTQNISQKKSINEETNAWKRCRRCC